MGMDLIKRQKTVEGRRAWRAAVYRLGCSPWVAKSRARLKSNNMALPNLPFIPPPFSPGNHKIENQTLKSSMEGELSSNPSHPLQWAPLGSTQDWALAFPTGLNRQGRSVTPRRPVRASAEPHRTRPAAAPGTRIMVGNSQQGGTSEAGALR